MEHFKDRLKKLIEYKFDGSARQFALKTGITGGTISLILSGKTKSPSHSTIQKIRKTMPDISLRWFQYGDGEMIKIESRSLFIERFV